VERVTDEGAIVGDAHPARTQRAAAKSRSPMRRP